MNLGTRNPLSPGYVPPLRDILAVVQVGRMIRVPIAGTDTARSHRNVAAIASAVAREFSPRDKPMKFQTRKVAGAIEVVRIA